MHQHRLLASVLIPGLLLSCAGCRQKSPGTASENSPAQTAANPAPSAPSSVSPVPANASPTVPSPPVVSPPASAPAAAATPAAPAAPAPAVASVPQPEPASASVPAQPADPPKPPEPKPIIIPSGTTLRVRLVQPLGSKLSQDGQSFDASFSSPVVVHGKTVIPVGTMAVGTVTEAHASGRFKGGASLVLRLDSIRMKGQAYPIHAAPFDQTSKGKGKRTAAMVGGGAGAGALIGGIAGGGKGALIGGLIGGGAGTAGAATGNRDITLPSETVVSFQLTSSLRLK